MKSHFIKDTNEQYSIREDGVIVRHYRLSPKKGIVYQEKVLTVYTAKNNNYQYLKLRVKGKYKGIALTTLLFKYLNYTLCVECKEKIKGLSGSRRLCPTCKQSQQESSLKHYWRDPKAAYLKGKKWKSNNLDKVKEWSNASSKREVDRMSRNYISKLLKIPIEDLSNELYQLKKITLKTKRLCQQKQVITYN
jgi:hypothetical protein